MTSNQSLSDEYDHNSDNEENTFNDSFSAISNIQLKNDFERLEEAHNVLNKIKEYTFYHLTFTLNNNKTQTLINTMKLLDHLDNKV